MEGYHVPVLYQECLDALAIQPNGVYVDATFGGGGHSRGILAALGPKGKLVAFDQDADAQANLPADDRLVFVPQNFRHLHRFLRLHGLEGVDGVLADLGVSSHQFDAGERGFSIRFEGPFDMRMDRRTSLTAQTLVQSYTEQALHKLFEQYGEVTNAKTLAKHIVTQRSHQPFASIEQFKAMIAPVVKGNPNKYLAQVFQALRIVVNDELGALQDMLYQLPSVVKPGGRAAIITFHSLEDRMVKQFFKDGIPSNEPEHPFLSVEKNLPFRSLHKKPVTASEEELKKNSRSRSAKLRVGIRN
ncbi:MAG: 16S rRNA (cytosine(1402)-N(4))-methyltransferase RsmH [Sphingobacteriia bacterium]|nr:MAG: 16S rRNA (cytosine(1402)-N(4))-methyltransferase RsmH [Sphingobacteriia bacterium]